MSESHSVQISTAAYRVIRNLKDTSGIMATLARVLDTQNQLTTGYIQQNFLSGPGKKDLRTLAVVTGLLRRSVHAVRARASGSVLFSGIGSNVKYAAAHEFGVDKEVTVKEHSMRNSIRDRFDASGVAVDRFTALRAGLLSKKQASQSVQDSGKYTFAKKRAKQVVTGGQIIIKAHSMHMHLAARRMFGRGIEARLAIYGRELSAAIIKEWGGN